MATRKPSPTKGSSSSSAAVSKTTSTTSANQARATSGIKAKSASAAVGSNSKTGVARKSLTAVGKAAAEKKAEKKDVKEVKGGGNVEQVKSEAPVQVNTEKLLNGDLKEEQQQQQQQEVSSPDQDVEMMVAPPLTVNDNNIVS